MEIIDIENAFLYGELEERIFMRISEGWNEYLKDPFEEDNCLILDKSIYGFV